MVHPFSENPNNSQELFASWNLLKLSLKKRYGVGKPEGRNGMEIPKNRILGAP